MAILVLNDGKTYAVADYATQTSFSILLDRLTADEVLETLTAENLSEYKFMTDSEAVTGVYRNKLLCGYADHGDSLEIHVNDADLCRYGLILDENSRIVSAVAQRYAPVDAVVVEELPDGDITEFLYVDGEYVYDPKPISPVTDPQPTQEERIAQLEQQNAMLTECILEMSGMLYA